MTGCKIGKIMMKNGGAPIYLAASRKELYNDETAILSSALNQAKSGYFIAVGIVVVTSDGQFSTAYSKRMKAESFAGIVGCDDLKRRITETLK